MEHTIIPVGSLQGGKIRVIRGQDSFSWTTEGGTLRKQECSTKGCTPAFVDGVSVSLRDTCSANLWTCVACSPLVPYSGLLVLPGICFVRLIVSITEIVPCTYATAT